MGQNGGGAFQVVDDVKRVNKTCQLMPLLEPTTEGTHLWILLQMINPIQIQQMSSVDQMIKTLKFEVSVLKSTYLCV